MRAPLLQDDPGVEGDGALARAVDDQGIEVHFDDLGRVGEQLADAQEAIFEGGDVCRGGPAGAAQQRVGPQRADLLRTEWGRRSY